VVFWLIFDDIAPGVISCEATYQLRPHPDSFPGVISFESIRVADICEESSCSRRQILVNCVSAFRLRGVRRKATIHPTRRESLHF
jgi:hypothetical protein